MAALYEAEACCSPGRSVQTSSLCSTGMAKQNLFTTHLFHRVSFKNIKDKKCCRKLWVLSKASDFCNRESQPTSVWIQTVTRNPNAQHQKWAMGSWGLMPLLHASVQRCANEGIYNKKGIHILKSPEVFEQKFCWGKTERLKFGQHQYWPSTDF